MRRPPRPTRAAARPLVRGLALALVAALAAAGPGCAGSAAREDRATLGLRRRVAREYVSRRLYDQALVHLGPLTRELPEDAELHRLRGVALRERGFAAEAEGELRRAIACDAKDALARDALGVLLVTGGRLEEGVRAHEAAVALAPDEGALLNNLGFALTLAGRSREAIGALRRALVLDPRNGRARTNLGFAYAAAGSLALAAREFARAGSAAEAKTNLGLAYEARGDLPRARALYREAVALDPRLQAARENGQALDEERRQEGAR